MHALVQLAYIMNGILCVNELIIVLQAIMHESNVVVGSALSRVAITLHGF